MKKQEIFEKFKKQMSIENYSKQSIKCYMSALNLFFQYIKDQNIEKIIDSEIQNFLYYCKDKKRYSFSSMKQVISTIRYLYLKVLYKPVPASLYITLKKPKKLPVILSK